MFEAAYYHPLHNPVSFWAVGLPLLVLFATRVARSADALGPPRFFAVFALLFQLEILLDAGLQGELTPLEGGAKTAVSIVLVVLGDLRFFVLLERLGRSEPRHWAVPVGLSLLVPAASTLVRRLFPDDPRYLFLVYEVMFAALAAVILWIVLPRRDLGPARARWMRLLAGFELVQYLLWASADVVILLGADVGFLLRLLPNAMYYACFVPFAWFTAPSELRP